MVFLGGRPLWLDQKTLEELGFDTSVAPTDKAAFEFYARQRARRAFVALEYDGPAWRKWSKDEEERSQTQPSLRADLPAERETVSRLMAIDASRDVLSLRTRHPDRGSVIIVPAVIRIGVEPQSTKSPGRLYGSIQEIPSTIHVPLPFSGAVRRLPGNRKDAKYFVQLRLI
jgi:hypothetical protein